MKKGLKIVFIALIAFVVTIPLSIAQSKFNKQPEFQGGDGAMLDFLQQNIKYPEKARQAKLEAVVYVSFIVNADGSLSGVEVKKVQYQKIGLDSNNKTPVENPSDRSLETEAVRVVKAMPKWTPGETDGKKTSIAYMLPVNFNLN